MLEHPNGVALCDCGRAWVDIAGAALVDRELNVLAFHGQVTCPCGRTRVLPPPERHLQLVGAIDKNS